MVYKHITVAALGIYALLGEAAAKRGRALKSHGNYIVDPGKSWNCVFEFLWEPCMSLYLV